MTRLILGLADLLGVFSDKRVEVDQIGRNLICMAGSRHDASARREQVGKLWMPAWRSECASRQRGSPAAKDATPVPRRLLAGRARVALGQERLLDHLARLVQVDVRRDHPAERKPQVSVFV